MRRRGAGLGTRDLILIGIEIDETLANWKDDVIFREKGAKPGKAFGMAHMNTIIFSRMSTTRSAVAIDTVLDFLLKHYFVCAIRIDGITYRAGYSIPVYRQIYLAIASPVGYETSLLPQLTTAASGGTPYLKMIPDDSGKGFLWAQTNNS